MNHYIKDSTLPDCNDCKNKRVRIIEERVYQCHCTNVGTPLLRYLDTTIGKMYQGVKINNLSAMDDPQKVLLQYAHRFLKWWKDGEKGLYLWSANTGNGKSLVGAAIINELGKPSQAIEASVLWDALRSCYESNESQLRYMSVASYVPALLLDDLGMGNTDKSDEWLTEILNARIEKGLLTIITSNLHPTKLKNVSDRCASRIMAHCHPIEVKNTKDWRVELKPYMKQ